MSYLYLVTIAALLAVFVACLALTRFFVNKLLTNIILVSITVAFYLVGVISSYIRNGPNDWNFLNTLPVANVSPFMFASCPLFFLLPGKARRYFGTLISLLTVGMLLSPTISCIHCFAIGYAFHWFFLSDYIAHIALAIFGVYLVYSKQVELRIKDALIGGSIVVDVAFTMLIINLCADTSFFGLSLRGKHNIYNQVIVENSYLSALIYFAGLAATLALGYLFQRSLEKGRACLARRKATT